MRQRGYVHSYLDIEHFFRLEKVNPPARSYTPAHCTGDRRGSSSSPRPLLLLFVLSLPIQPNLSY